MIVLRAGIPEAWLVDVHAQTITVFAEPHAGGFGEERLLSRGQESVSASVEGLRLQIDEAPGGKRERSSFHSSILSEACKFAPLRVG